MQSNFHQIRKQTKMLEKLESKEQEKKLANKLKSLDSTLLSGLAEQPNENGSEGSPTLGGKISPDLTSGHTIAEIEEDSEEESHRKIKEEANKFIKVSPDGKTIELISPAQSSSIKIKNSKIRIASDALRFEELRHIENTIAGMAIMPDFGYEGDNMIIERAEDAPRNWKLLTDFVYNKEKYQWL